MFSLLSPTEAYPGLTHLKEERTFHLRESGFSRIVSENIQSGHYSIYDSNNDTDHRFDISAESNAETVAALTALLEDKEISIYVVPHALRELCSRKIIPPGIYVLSISW